MPTQTILSPGVQINEVDLSLRAVVPNGTNVLVFGFANQGPIEEVFEIPDIQTFETIYAKPTNAAERYFYYSVKGVLDGGGRPLVARVPYGASLGSGTSDSYSCLVYPAVPYYQTLCATDLSLTNTTYSTEVSGYCIGAPTYFTLTESEYTALAQGNINWADNVAVSFHAGVKNNGFETVASIASAGVVVLNKFKSSFDAKTLEGYMIGICDSFDTDPSSSFTCVQSAKYAALSDSIAYNDFIDIPGERLNFSLSSPVGANQPSISFNIEQQGVNLNLFQGTYIDSISFKVVKLRQSIYTPDTTTLDYTMPDGYVGSLNSYRKVQDINGGQPKGFFIGDVESDSTYVQVLVNPNIASRAGDWTNAAGKPSKFVLINHSNSGSFYKLWDKANNKGFLNTSLYTQQPLTATTLGGALSTAVVNMFNTYVKPVTAMYSYSPTYLVNTATQGTAYAVGNLPGKINRIFQTLDDVDAQRIDLSAEAGLGTIYASTATLGVSAFDDTLKVNIGSTSGASYTGFYRTDGNLGEDTLTTTVPGVVASNYTAEDYKNNYLAVYEEFRVFAQSTRKDHLFVADPIRPIFISGAKTKVLADRNNTFVTHIYTPLKNQYDTTSTSYATVYGNWALVSDTASGTNVWVPFSGMICGMMAQDDTNYAPWYAPAGFTRGKFPSPVLDIAVSPSQRNRDLLYKIGINPITKFPNDGITVFGQKTKLTTPSAFDRINVRRLFLYLEKLTRSTMKYFVFEPNTLFTRTRVVNVLKPQFDIVKNSQGMYDYLIVCDERNNTPEVIDQNQLIVDIYIKPVRAAEFILVNFYATRTDQNFNELI